MSVGKNLCERFIIPITTITRNQIPVGKGIREVRGNRLGQLGSYPVRGALRALAGSSRLSFDVFGAVLVQIVWPVCNLWTGWTKIPLCFVLDGRSTTPKFSMELVSLNF
jgi:hypothetical protein